MQTIVSQLEGHKLISNGSMTKVHNSSSPFFIAMGLLLISDLIDELHSIVGIVLLLQFGIRTKQLMCQN
jgi:hypothetical protein